MFIRFSTNRLFVSILACLALACPLSISSVSADEIIGPVNLVKTMPTPFTADEHNQAGDSGIRISPESRQSSAISRGLSNRLIGPRMYLPGRMTLGQPSEFIIKGRPGSWAAIAMADKNSGAKPVFGHDLRLGADRKLVTLGQIPEGGVLSLSVETPIQGDLIGQCLYFEAAIWSQPDFSDLELAQPIPSEESAATPNNDRKNGVLIAAEAAHKRGFKFGLDTGLNSITPMDSANTGKP